MVSSSTKRVKAAIVVLARNKDVEDVLLSMQRMEHSFNHKYNYPYVFLNNDIWEGEFKNRYILLPWWHADACTAVVKHVVNSNMEVLGNEMPKALRGQAC